MKIIDAIMKGILVYILNHFIQLVNCNIEESPVTCDFVGK